MLLLISASSLLMALNRSRAWLYPCVGWRKRCSQVPVVRLAREFAQFHNHPGPLQTLRRDVLHFSFDGEALSLNERDPQGS